MKRLILNSKTTGHSYAVEWNQGKAVRATGPINFSDFAFFLDNAVVQSVEQTVALINANIDDFYEDEESLK